MIITVSHLNRERILGLVGGYPVAAAGSAADGEREKRRTVTADALRQPAAGSSRRPASKKKE